MPSELHPTRFLAPVLTGATSTAAIFGDLIPHRPELSQLTLLENITRDQVLFGDHWGNFGLAVAFGAAARTAVESAGGSKQLKYLVIGTGLLLGLVAENGSMGIPMLEFLQSIHLVSDVSNIFHNPEVVGDLFFTYLGLELGWRAMDQNLKYGRLVKDRQIVTNPTLETWENDEVLSFS